LQKWYYFLVEEIYAEVTSWYTENWLVVDPFKPALSNGMMSADIFKRKRAHAIQLKWTFLTLKRAVFCLKIVSYFSKKANPANSNQNLNIMQL